MSTEAYKSNFRLQIAVVSIGILLLLVKFSAFFMTNSNAILSDALESIINVVAGAVGLYSIYLSMQPVDQDHPYGHGKVEFLAAGFEGSLILIAGISIISKAIYNLIYPSEVMCLHIGIYFVALTGIINYGLGWYMKKQGRASSSITMEAGGEHLITDAYTSIGLIIGLALVMLTGKVAIDNIVALIFGAIILFSAFKIIRKALAGIMDETDESLIEEVVDFINNHRENHWIDIHNLRCIRYGPRLHIDCHVTIPWYYNVQEGHDVLEEIHELIDNEADSQVEMFIHADPCQPFSCRICQLNDCKKRQQVFQERIEWTVKNSLPNKKHR